MSVEHASPTAPPRARAKHAQAWDDARKAAIEGYVALAADVLHLRDWTIEVDWSRPCSASALAEVTQMSDSKHAFVRVSPKLVDLEPRLRSQVLVHELVHCHLFALHALASSVVALTASKDAVKVFEVAMTARIEEATDALADVVAKFLPELRFDPPVQDNAARS